MQPVAKDGDYAWYATSVQFSLSLFIFLLIFLFLLFFLFFLLFFCSPLLPLSLSLFFPRRRRNRFAQLACVLRELVEPHDFVSHPFENSPLSFPFVFPDSFSSFASFHYLPPFPNPFFPAFILTERMRRRQEQHARDEKTRGREGEREKRERERKEDS